MACISCPECGERIEEPKRKCPFCSAELPETLYVVLRADGDFIPGGVAVLDVEVTNNGQHDLRNLDFTMASKFFKEPVSLSLGRAASRSCVGDRVEIEFKPGLVGTAFLSLNADCVDCDGVPRVYAVRDTMKVTGGGRGGTQVINIQNSEFVQVSDLKAGVKQKSSGPQSLEFVLYYESPAMERQCPFCGVKASPDAEICTSCHGTFPTWLFKRRIDIAAPGPSHELFDRWRIVMPGSRSVTRVLMDNHVVIGRHSERDIYVYAVDKADTVKVSKFVCIIGHGYGIPVYVRMHYKCHCTFMVNDREILSSREQIPLEDSGMLSFGYIDDTPESSDEDFVVHIEYRRRIMMPAGSEYDDRDRTRKHTMNMRFTNTTENARMDTSILLLNSASIGSGDDMDICLKGLDHHHGNVICSEQRLWFENLSDKPCKLSYKRVVEDVPKGVVVSIPDEVSVTLGRVVLLFEPF